MRRRLVIFAITIAQILAYLPGPASAGDWPFHHKPRAGEAVSLEQVAKEIDCIEDKVLDDGTVVMKHPDVYGQSRMTLYRKNFEQQLFGAIGNFNAVLSARNVRSDQQGILSQSNLTASLSSAAPSGGGGLGGRGSGTKAAAGTSSNTVAVVTPHDSSGGGGGSPASGGIIPNGFAPGTISPSAPFAPLGGKPFSGPFAAQGVPYGLGIEPTVYLDQLANYQNHLNRLRRVNMGDDIADSAGYGLYLIRMPISIQPGECTNKGHGAVLTATVRHDFGPDFLYTTYRNLVINDLVDLLTPAVFELIRSKSLDLLDVKDIPAANRKYKFYKYFENNKADFQLNSVFLPPVPEDAVEGRARQLYEKYSIYANSPFSQYPYNLAKETGEMKKAGAAASENSAKITDIFSKSNSIYATMTRSNDRSFPIAPTEFDDVLIDQNLVVLALHARESLQTAVPRATDVRAFLQNEIGAAYDIISQIYGASDPGAAEVVSRFEESVGRIAVAARTREYDALQAEYINLASALPGDLRYYVTKDRIDPSNSLISPLTILCYAIAVDAGLLDEQLRIDMKRVLGKDGEDVSDVDGMHFYSRYPTPEAEARFREYVEKRWPLITFSVDPFIDEQNVADASSVRRDLQLALAFAFSTGQINFNQLLQFQRRVEFDSETIALNQTVSSFAHGDDTFGFRFRPRFQNPPPERSNFQSIANQLLKGGPGRNYQLNNSKLEPGQRELGVVLLMPSFLQGIKMDITGNWFPLVDPDQMKTPTPRMIEQGRKVVALREAMACIHDQAQYRPGDVRRLETRVHQIEAMLPMQTHTIGVPYENTLGGFQLFQQGTTALVPQLDGFEGADAIVENQETDLLIYGKHFSVQETNVVVGGRYLSGLNLDAQQAIAAAKSNLNAAQSSTKAADQTAAADSKKGQGAGKDADGGGQTEAADATDAAKTATHNAANQSMQAAQQSLVTLQASAPANAGSSLNPSATPASNPAFDVVSRQVLRINIPAGVTSTDVFNVNRQGTQAYVEVYVATPNGISNKLLIPYRSKGGAPAKPAATPGYALSTDSLTITYQANVVVDTGGNKTYNNVRHLPDPKNSQLKITLTDAEGVVPKVIGAEFDATIPGPPDQPWKFTRKGIPGKKGVFGVDVGELAQSLMDPKISGLILKNVDQNPSLSTTVKLTPTITVSPDFEAVERTAGGGLKVQIKIIPVLSVGVAPPASPAPGATVPAGGNPPGPRGSGAGGAVKPRGDAPAKPADRLPPPPAEKPPGGLEGLELPPEEAPPILNGPVAPVGGGTGGNPPEAAGPQASARRRAVAPASAGPGSGRDEAIARSSYRSTTRGRSTDPVDLPPLPASPRPGAAQRAVDPRVKKAKAPAPAPADDRDAIRRPRWPWPSR